MSIAISEAIEQIFLHAEANQALNRSTLELILTGLVKKEPDPPSDPDYKIDLLTPSIVAKFIFLRDYAYLPGPQTSHLVGCIYCLTSTITADTHITKAFVNSLKLVNSVMLYNNKPVYIFKVPRM
jgi:hypothetical protein